MGGERERERDRERQRQGVKERRVCISRIQRYVTVSLCEEEVEIKFDNVEIR